MYSYVTVLTYRNLNLRMSYKGNNIINFKWSSRIYYATNNTYIKYPYNFTIKKTRKTFLKFLHLPSLFNTDKDKQYI
jgi:hypothetical protein